MTTKRHIASWLLLAVFLPMLVLSSVHVHEAAKNSQDNCKECVHHQCNGHLGELTTSMHSCVLCQFQTFSFVAATLFAVVLFNQVRKLNVVQRQSNIRLDVCGIPTLRAPPVRKK